MAFFKEWVARQPQSGYIAYDVTSFSSRAAGVSDKEWGYNRNRERLPQINFGCYLGQKNGLPIFYVIYPGSIVDKSHLPYMMAYNKTLNICNVCFVMDRGFCTTANVLYMHAKRLPYVMGVEIGHKATRAAITNVRDSIISIRNLVKAGIYARSIHSRFYGAASTMHIYYDPDLAERQRRDLYRSVEVEEERLCQLEQLTKKDAKRYRAHFNIEIADDCTFIVEAIWKRGLMLS
jgi:transposase